LIRIPTVRVVDEEGRQLGVMPTFEALRLAQDRGYDLVEVAPNSVPPVTRLLDYGQYKYEAAKKEKEARRHQRSVDFKEIRIKPKIGTGDFDTKVRRAIQFLEDGDRVKVACQFRGRELTHAHIGRDLLIRFGELLRDHGTLERQPLLEGKSMSIVVASTHKPKPQGVEAPRGEDEAGESRETAPMAGPPEEPAGVAASMRRPSAAQLPVATAMGAAARPAPTATGPAPVKAAEPSEPLGTAQPLLPEPAPVAPPAAELPSPAAPAARAAATRRGATGGVRRSGTATPATPVTPDATDQPVADQPADVLPADVLPAAAPATSAETEAVPKPAGRSTRAKLKTSNEPSTRPGE
jgi:translation initiation factor IF-3